MTPWFTLSQCVPLYFFLDFTRMTAAPAAETVQVTAQKRILALSPVPGRLSAGIFSVSFSPQTEQTRSFLPLR